MNVQLLTPAARGAYLAKAVFAKLPDGSATLLVGSANLTEQAFTQNHELGLWVNLLGEPDVSREFQSVAQSLGGTRHDESLEDSTRFANLGRVNFERFVTGRIAHNL